MLIILEGPDGAGKDTVAAGLVTLLSIEGYKVHILAEPPESSMGQYFRDRVISSEGDVKPSMLNEALLFMISRRENYERFIPEALIDNDIVIVTRNWMSTEAYQMYDVPDHLTSTLDILNRTLIDDLVTDIPVVEILLYCEFEVAYKRMVERGTTDKIESRGQTYLGKVNARYAGLIGTPGVHAVDAARSKLHVLGDVWAIVEEEL